MRLLLDTHIWLWSHLDPDRLNKRVAAALRAPTSELWLSPVSVWEFLLLVEKKRVSLALDPQKWLELALANAPMRDAPLTREVAIESRHLRLSHQDPADRFIAATAQVFDLTLVTEDRKLLRGKGYDKLPNA